MLGYMFLFFLSTQLMKSINNRRKHLMKHFYKSVEKNKKIIE
jgi:hypothetical protein